MSSREPSAKSKSWDAVADWYAGWSGAEGSRHHRAFAIPSLLSLLEPKRGERLLDIGCGAGALASAIQETGMAYVGVDLSSNLIALAKSHYKDKAQFLLGDATSLGSIRALSAGSFDASTFLLSIQDINPLEQAIAGAAWALKAGGRLAILMIHPCFRVPRQSGWGWDEGRQLTFRRVDRYLTRLDVPMQKYSGRSKGFTRSYHRPLQDYFAELDAAGLRVERLIEIPGPPPGNPKSETRADRLAREDIPLFLGLRAIKTAT